MPDEVAGLTADQESRLARLLADYEAGRLTTIDPRRRHGLPGPIETYLARTTSTISGISIATITRTGSTTTDTVLIQSLSDTTDLAPGMAVSGSGIPAGTRILTVDSASQISLALAATASASVSLTFTSTVLGSGTADLYRADFSGRVSPGGLAQTIYNRGGAVASGEWVNVLREPYSGLLVIGGGGGCCTTHLEFLGILTEIAPQALDAHELVLVAEGTFTISEDTEVAVTGMIGFLLTADNFTIFNTFNAGVRGWLYVDSTPATFPHPAFGPNSDYIQWIVPVPNDTTVNHAQWAALQTKVWVVPSYIMTAGVHTVRLYAEPVGANWPPQIVLSTNRGTAMAVEVGCGCITSGSGSGTGTGTGTGSGTGTGTGTGSGTGSGGNNIFTVDYAGTTSEGMPTTLLEWNVSNLTVGSRLVVYVQTCGSLDLPVSVTLVGGGLGSVSLVLDRDDSYSGTEGDTAVSVWSGYIGTVTSGSVSVVYGGGGAVCQVLVVEVVNLPTGAPDVSQTNSDTFDLDAPINTGTTAATIQANEFIGCCFGTIAGNAASGVAWTNMTTGQHVGCTVSGIAYDLSEGFTITSAIGTYQGEATPDIGTAGAYVGLISTYK